MSLQQAIFRSKKGHFGISNLRQNTAAAGNKCVKNAAIAMAVAIFGIFVLDRCRKR